MHPDLQRYRAKYARQCVQARHTADHMRLVQEQMDFAVNEELQDLLLHLQLQHRRQLRGAAATAAFITLLEKEGVQQDPLQTEIPNEDTNVF